MSQKWQRNQCSYRRKIQQDALGKVNRIKEMRRKGKDGLKITDNKHYVRKKPKRVATFLEMCWGPNMSHEPNIEQIAVVFLFFA